MDTTQSGAFQSRGSAISSLPPECLIEIKNMAKLNEKTIQALQEILRAEYGREVSFAEATDIANALVGYFDLLARIYHRRKNEDRSVPD